jgi:hypothetical protein
MSSHVALWTLNAATLKRKASSVTLIALWWWNANERNGFSDASNPWMASHVTVWTLHAALYSEMKCVTCDSNRIVVVK